MELASGFPAIAISEGGTTATLGDPLLGSCEAAPEAVFKFEGGGDGLLLLLVVVVVVEVVVVVVAAVVVVIVIGVE